MLQKILDILINSPDGLTAMKLNEVVLGEGGWRPENREKLYMLQSEIRRGLDNGSIRVGSGLKLFVGAEGVIPNEK